MIKFSEKQLCVVELGVVILTAILWSFDYLLFHSVVEFLCAVVAVVIASRIWKQRHVYATPFGYVLSFTLVTVAGIDILHLLAYEGMAVFRVDETNVATQLWIVSRYIFALGFLGAITLTIRKGLVWLLLCAAVLCSVAVVTVFSGAFPAAYHVGEGLTQFKIMSEYIIIAVLIASILHISFRQTPLPR